MLLDYFPCFSVQLPQVVQSLFNCPHVVLSNWHGKCVGCLDFSRYGYIWGPSLFKYSLLTWSNTSSSNCAKFSSFPRNLKWSLSCNTLMESFSLRMRFSADTNFPLLTVTVAHLCSPHSSPISLNMLSIRLVSIIALVGVLWYVFKSST